MLVCVVRQMCGPCGRSYKMSGPCGRCRRPYPPSSRQSHNRIDEYLSRSPYNAVTIDAVVGRQERSSNDDDEPKVESQVQKAIS